MLLGKAIWSIIRFKYQKIIFKRKQDEKCSQIYLVRTLLSQQCLPEWSSFRRNIGVLFNVLHNPSSWHCLHPPFVTPLHLHLHLHPALVLVVLECWSSGGAKIQIYFRWPSSHRHASRLLRERLISSNPEGWGPFIWFCLLSKYQSIHWYHPRH